MYSKKIKDYESIEETQNIKSSYDDGEIGMETEQKKSYKSLIVAIIAIVFFFGLIAYLFITKLKSPNSQTNQQLPPIQQNPQIPQNLVSQNSSNVQNQPLQQSQPPQQNQPPQQSQPPQQNQPAQQSQSGQINGVNQQNENLTLQSFNFSSLKDHNHTILPINELLPKTNKKDANNITEIFKSKRLYINTKPLSNEYIKFIKPLNETIEAKYRQILFPNLTFDNYSVVHVHNYSMYLSYLNKTKSPKKNKTRTHHNDTKILNNTNLNSTNNISNASVNNLNNLTNLTFIINNNNTNNQSLINPINSQNNQSLTNQINNAINQSMSNPFNSPNNQSSVNPMNVSSNQSSVSSIHSSSNQSFVNPVNSASNESLANPINSANNQSLINPVNFLREFTYVDA